MPINSECKYLKSGAWSKNSYSGSANGSESPENHAERLAWSEAAAKTTGTNNTYLFEQNAFPCAKCISFFLSKSLAGGTYVFACTANNGFYAAESGFVATADSPSAKQDLKIRGVLYASGGQLYARKKRITCTQNGADWTFKTVRDITIDVTTAIPQNLRDLPDIEVDFG